MKVKRNADYDLKFIELRAASEVARKVIVLLIHQSAIDLTHTRSRIL
jgi:hypothetical protein